MRLMFDKIVYGILDTIVKTAETLRTCYRERRLPKQCRENWAKGYNEWKKKHK